MAMWKYLIGLEPEAINQSDSEKIFDWSRATTVVYTIYMYTVSLSYVYVLYILSYTNE